MSDPKPYTVQPIKQQYGIIYAVVCDGVYKFSAKSKTKAQSLADRLNMIRNNRETVGYG